MATATTNAMATATTNAMATATTNAMATATTNATVPANATVAGTVNATATANATSSLDVAWGTRSWSRHDERGRVLGDVHCDCHSLCEGGGIGRFRCARWARRGADCRGGVGDRALRHYG